MDARDLIVIARRRAALSQRELADRLARPQATVARWEAGAREPSYAAVQQVLRACGLQVLIGLASYDDSDVALAHRQLDLPAVERVDALALARDRTAIAETLTSIGDSGARLVVIGAIGAALQGSPVVLANDRVDTVVHPADRERAATDLTGTSARILDAPPGTRGYGDLARNADTCALGEHGSINVAGLHDLLRIALTDRSEPSATSEAIGLDAAIRARRARDRSESPRTPGSAHEEIERWLSRQHALRL